jgi:hypothetical protein
MTNPFMLDAGAPWRERLGGVGAPTLVVHGTLTYGIALERLVDEDDVPDALLGCVLQLLFRGLRAEADAAARPRDPNSQP